MKFAIIANPSKYEVRDVISRTIEWAGKNKVELLISSQSMKENAMDEAAHIRQTSSDEDAIEQSDVVIVMGGDGTILYTARISKHLGKPILGVNSGRLGFMANTQKEELERALECIIRKNYSLDKRAFLKAADKFGNEYFALNEFLFTRKASTSMITITAEYDGSLINTYWADGLLVASPTGSTAYNLASGGPIVSPGTDVFVVTPINPHTLTTRPLVLNSTKSLKILMEEQQYEVLFSYDGKAQEIEKLPFEVEIMKSSLTFNLIHLPGQNYFETLRNKLMWGMDLRRK